MYGDKITKSDICKVLGCQSNLALFPVAPTVSRITYVESGIRYEIPLINESLKNIREVHNKRRPKVPTSVLELRALTETFDSLPRPPSLRSLGGPVYPVGSNIRARLLESRRSQSPALLKTSAQNKIITTVTPLPDCQNHPTVDKQDRSQESSLSESDPEDPERHSSSCNQQSDSWSSSFNINNSDMAHNNSITFDGVFETGSRTPLLDPIYLSTLTSNFGPYRKLILTSLSTQWFKAPITAYDDTMIIAANAVCDERLNMLDAFSAARHATLLTGELAAPFLPSSSYMSPKEADDEFLAIVRSMMRSQGLTEMFEGLTPATYTALRQTADPALPQVYPFTEQDQFNMTTSLAVKLLKLLLGCGFAR